MASECGGFCCILQRSWFKNIFMYLLQPTNRAPVQVMGDCSEKCLGNAMNMTWVDWAKSPAAKQGILKDL